MLVCDYIVEQIDGDYAHLEACGSAGGGTESSCQSITSGRNL